MVLTGFHLVGGWGGGAILHCKKQSVHDTHVVCIWRQIWCAVHTHLSLYAHQ